MNFSGLGDWLRKSFLSDWHENAFPDSYLDHPRFQRIAHEIAKTLKPITTDDCRYEFRVIFRRLKQVDQAFAPDWTIPLARVFFRSSPGPLEISQPDSEEPVRTSAACSECAGLGANGPAGIIPKVPRELLAMHHRLVQLFHEEHFSGMRIDRGLTIASELAELEYQTRLSLGPSILQIAFVGVISGFASKLDGGAALVHCPAAWDYPVRLANFEGTGVWNFPETGIEGPVPRSRPFPKDLGVDPAAPDEHLVRPWRRPCDACHARGTAA